MICWSCLPIRLFSLVRKRLRENLKMGIYRKIMQRNKQQWRNRIYDGDGIASCSDLCDGLDFIERVNTVFRLIIGIRK